MITWKYIKTVQQKCQRTEAERGNYVRISMRQRDVHHARCKIHEELMIFEAENDALRDDVAAGRRRLHIKTVCRISTTNTATASGVDNAASPTGEDTAGGIISPQREADHYAKTTGRNPEVY